MAHHRLEQSQSSPHSWRTSGQSRWGGVETSNHRRRSSSLGRVAVTMSKALPKGGSALCLCRVSNTRLRPVPPSYGEAGLYRGQFTNSNLHRVLPASCRSCAGSRA